MESVKLCEASPEDVKAAWQIGLCVGLGMYAVLWILGFILVRRNVIMLVSYSQYALLARLMPGFTLVGAVAFLADASKERHSLVTCDPWSDLQWVASLMNLCFIVRLFVNFGVTYRPQLVATVVDVWLFTQAWITLSKGLNLYAFTFLTLVRFFHSECVMVWNRLSTVIRTGSGMVLATLVVAGALQVAEEHGTMYGAHSTAQGTLQPIRSFWTYVYWTVVTLSTVGYGEITPSTNASKVVAGLAVVAGVIWYVMVAARMSVAMKKYFREARYPPPESSRPRIIVLGQSDPNNLTHLLRAVKKEDENDLEVIVLVSSELMTPYHLRLNGVLPIKVLSYTDLQQDLINLLPATDNKRYSHARQQDAIVLFGDHEAKDPELEDARVLHLLVKVRACVPGRRLVVLVILSRSRRAVMQTPCWCSHDVVVCLEELIVDLLAQATVCSAAGPIMSNLLQAPTVSCEKVKDPGLVGNCREMQNICYYEPNGSNPKGGDFVDNALWLYEERGSLLLGWFSPETHNFNLFHNEIPLGVQWVVIANSNLPKTHSQKFKTLGDLKCCDHTETLRVSVWGEEPGCTDLEDALHKFPDVKLLPKEEWSSASTVVMTTVGMPANFVMESHYQQIMVKRSTNTKPIRFLTDVHPGQGHKVLDHRTTSDVVSKSMVMWAIAGAIVDHKLYDVWRQLVANNTVVSMVVLVDCTYEDTFQKLLSDRLCPVGVKIVREDDCYIINPSASLQLAPGDLVMCIQLTPTDNTLPTITRGTGYNTKSSTYFF